jgi:hypothetical protein
LENLCDNNNLLHCQNILPLFEIQNDRIAHRDVPVKKKRELDALQNYSCVAPFVYRDINVIRRGARVSVPKRNFHYAINKALNHAAKLIQTIHTAPNLSHKSNSRHLLDKRREKEEGRTGLQHARQTTCTVGSFF